MSRCEIAATGEPAAWWNASFSQRHGGTRYSHTDGRPGRSVGSPTFVSTMTICGFEKPAETLTESPETQQMALRFLQVARSRVAQGYRGFSSAAAAAAGQTSRPTYNLQQSEAGDPRINSFKYFNQKGGKFRVTVVNRCNFNCFFCHNEGMDNPREPGAHLRLPTSPPSGDPAR